MNDAKTQACVDWTAKELQSASRCCPQCAAKYANETMRHAQRAFLAGWEAAELAKQDDFKTGGLQAATDGGVRHEGESSSSSPSTPKNGWGCDSAKTSSPVEHNNQVCKPDCGNKGCHGSCHNPESEAAHEENSRCNRFG